MDENSGDRPPLFRTWNGAYWLVLGALAGTIAVFALVTWIYR
jgi:hypothetical protein